MRRTCAEPGCTAWFRDHKWGRIRAEDKGWFCQKNGEVWCPVHVPGWVAEWRARKR